MHLPGTVEWLFNAHCAILPFRWEIVNCCPRSCPHADRDDVTSNVRLGRNHEIDCRSFNLPSSRYTISDADNDATCASLREARKDEDSKLKFVSKEGLPDCNIGECPQDQCRFIISPEVAALVSDRDEGLDWQEEKKQWVSAGGVSTPSDLERKIEDMRRDAAINEASLKELTCHVAEVKKFLLQLHDIDKSFVESKRRCERLSRRRKRSRRRCAAMECCCATSDNQESSTERAPKQARGSLLDPQIMRSFGTLINSSV